MEFNLDRDAARDVSIYLIDFLMLFIGSTAARYNPVVWSKVLRGETSELVNRIGSAYVMYPECVDYFYRKVFRPAADALRKKPSS